MSEKNGSKSKASSEKQNHDSQSLKRFRETAIRQAPIYPPSMTGDDASQGPGSISVVSSTPSSMVAILESLADLKHTYGVLKSDLNHLAEDLKTETMTNEHYLSVLEKKMELIQENVNNIMNGSPDVPSSRAKKRKNDQELSPPQKKIKIFAVKNTGDLFSKEYYDDGRQTIEGYDVEVPKSYRKLKLTLDDCVDFEGTSQAGVAYKCKKTPDGEMVMGTYKVL